MLRRAIVAGMVLASAGLLTGCCHDHQSCCSPAVARYTPAPRPCCPPAGGAVAVPAAPVPAQAFSSPGISYSSGL